MRAPSPAIEPAADAAALLRRIGFATLTLVVPTVALLARRGVVVFAAIGIALLALAAALDRESRPVSATLGRRARSWSGLGGGLVLLWCALSLLWTPFPASAAEELLSVAATLMVGVAGYIALPNRMRSANLYLVPIGATIASVTAIGLALAGRAERGFASGGPSLERGLIILVLLLWPSVAWLRSRGRDIEALALAGLVAVAVMVGAHPLPAAALAAGALVYIITAAAPAFGIAATGFVMAGSLALAPLIPFVAHPVASFLLGGDASAVASLDVWRRVVVGEPLRLITGHGFETALLSRLVGLLPPNAPKTLLFEIWYELGVVGALAGAVALLAGARGVRSRDPVLVPGTMAAFAAAFTLSCFGLGTGQLWWLTALTIVVLVFAAAGRGQVRTKRPKARFLQAANDA